MKEIDVSKNISIRNDEGDTFIVGAVDKIFIDEEANRGMIEIKPEDIAPLIEALKAMELYPRK